MATAKKVVTPRPAAKVRSVRAPSEASDLAARAFAAVVADFAADPEVAPPAASARKFGSNALKVNGKIFAMLVRGAFVVKLPQPRVDALVLEGVAAPFDAGKGTPMRQWVTLRDARPRWKALAREARTFVGAVASGAAAASSARRGRGR